MNGYLNTLPQAVLQELEDEAANELASIRGTAPRVDMKREAAKQEVTKKTP